MGFTGAAHRSGRISLMLIAAICIIGIAMLGKEVALDLDRLNTADSDNVQWTLSQAEVEFLELRNSVEQAALMQSSPDLLALRIEFDIFYSRVETLRTSSIFADLRKDPVFAQPLADVRAYLVSSVPAIDSSDTDLQAQLPELADATGKIRPQVRDLANTGLFHFAEVSDARRRSIWSTLVKLAVVTGALTLALGLMARRANRTANQTRRRGQELAAAYSRLNTILETSLDAVIVADMSGRILEFNEAAERTFKRRFVEVVGRRMGDIIVPDYMRETHENNMRSLRENPEAPSSFVGLGRIKREAVRSDGEVFPIELAVEMAETNGDRILVAFLRDISHRVAAEKELVDARDAALAGEKAKADFLAVMTHEIRTPLNGVLGNLSLLEETPLNDKQARYVHNMRVSGKLLMHHVDAVLDIARFESGKMTLTEEPMHLGNLLQEIVDGQSSAAEAKGNVLRWNWDGEPVEWVQADPSRLQQILLNLVGNAIKFTDNGQITIEAAQYRAKSMPGVAQVELRIIDTGVGISQAEQTKVFDDFQTSDAAFSRRVGGTGLGLGIARRFAQAMGGEIGVESTPGEGSVFWLRLPLALTDAPASLGSHAQIEASPQSLAHNDVLVVEDNEINMMVVREMLEAMGQSVTEADNGLTGVEIAAERRFDLILMDISMPVMDGLEAARNIRAGTGASRDVPIIALSANVLPEAKDRFVEAGMSGFLSKPLRKEELRTVIAEYETLDGEPDLAEDDAATPAQDSPAHDTEGGGTVAPSSSGISQEVADETRAQLGDAVFEKLRRRFAEETDDLILWFKTGPEDLTELAQRSHKVAGSAAVFGAMALRDTLIQIESEALNGNASAAHAKVEVAVRLWSETGLAFAEAPGA